MQVSLFASAVRPKLWESFLKSLENTIVKYEVIFAGNADNPIYLYNDKVKYFFTKNIKPAQCYEIARRECTGEVVVWVADDCEFPNNVIGHAYRYWKSQNNDKLILSIQTKESGYNLPEGTLFDMNLHRFFGGVNNTPLMAPLGMMSRTFLNELGGIDRRYVCGQYENDIVMRAYTKGATVEIFGNEDCFIDIDHLGKSMFIGESTTEESFLKRPFASGYKQDRTILENSWTIFNEKKLIEILDQGRYEVHLEEVKDIVTTQIDQFEPYSDPISLTHSESNRGQWE